MQTVYLEPSLYHAFVEGAEVLCPQGLGLREGEHVMVFKNTVSALSDVTVPHAGQNSDSIGVEALVIDADTNATANLLSLKKV